MPTETCGICDTTVPMSDAVHVMLHTKSDAGIVDYYVCRGCYEDDIATLFE